MALAAVAARARLIAVLQLLAAAAIEVRRPSPQAASSLLETGSKAAGQGRSQGGVTSRFDAIDNKKYFAALGVQNKMGVTKYQDHEFRKVDSTDGKFFWQDSANHEQNSYAGAKDLTQSVTWGWHHPTGVYSTIPVGSPLIDAQSNIYLGADDAVRKFDANGVLKWSYAPRGQLAAAPSLCDPSSRRLASRVRAEGDASIEEQEDMLRPDWAKGNQSGRASQFFQDFQVGDLVKVKPGASYWADGKELYGAGDQGMISGVVPGEQGKEGRAVILWTRTGTKTVVELHTITDRFSRVEQKKDTTLPAMLVGSTTSGYVFAIDLDSGDELWATWASNDIAGVKGSVAAKDGVVVVATDRCTDRYCYRYRNTTNPLTEGNSRVRGLSAADGSAIWEYKTMAPVWNMVPLWGPNSDVIFQDWEGRLYSLDLQTGALRYRVGGNIGTHTHAAATYDAGHEMVIALGVGYYQDKYCNPYIAPGILINCNTWPGVRGFIRGYNVSSGHKLWERETPEPPASAAVGMTSSWAPGGHTRLVVTMGYNCMHNSPSQIWAIDPNNGHIRWKRDGPTLWTSTCAGDKEGADIRRAMGGRAACVPNSWSTPAIDANGDVYVGNQVGVLQKYGSPTGRTADVALLSTLTTGHAFQDSAIAFGEGIMAISTCTSLIVLQTSEDYLNTTDTTVTAPPNLDGEPYGYNPFPPPA